MLLANVLRNYFPVPHVLRLFDNDVRGVAAPYSIQNVAEIGLTNYGICPGEWYGISTCGQVFEKLDKKYRPVENLRLCTF
jgi:hypothetical protein